MVIGGVFQPNTPIWKVTICSVILMSSQQLEGCHSQWKSYETAWTMMISQMMWMTRCSSGMVGHSNWMTTEDSRDLSWHHGESSSPHQVISAMERAAVSEDWGHHSVTPYCVLSYWAVSTYIIIKAYFYRLKGFPAIYIYKPQWQNITIKGTLIKLRYYGMNSTKQGSPCNFRSHNWLFVSHVRYAMGYKYKCQ